MRDERRREYDRLYRIRNREKIKAKRQSEAYRQRHREHCQKWREANPRYMSEWQKAHRDKTRQYARKFRLAHPAEKDGHPITDNQRPTLTPEERKERQRESKRRWRDRNREQERARHRQWRIDNPDKERERQRRNYAKGMARLTPDERRQRAHLKWFRRIIREMLDCDFYAKNRKAARERQYKRWAKQGKDWCKGQPARRIPDWCVRGGVLDARSPFLFENATPEQKAYARSLFIERREQLRKMM